jgi:hypothetical protein
MEQHSATVNKVIEPQYGTISMVIETHSATVSKLTEQPLLHLVR